MDDDDRAEEWQRLADELAAAQGEVAGSTEEKTLAHTSASPHSLADVDSKTSALTSIQHELTAAATTSDSSASLFISPLKPCLKSSNFHVFSLALGLVPLIVRLLDTSSHDGQRSVHAAVVQLTPPTLERAGDARERVREAALKALIEIGKIALVGAPPPSLNSSRGHSSGDTPLSIYESLITSSGLLAKSPRIREQACRLLTALRSHSSTRFPIKPFLPGLVDLLADADGACREAARATLVALFASASAPAKADLKREMEVKAVRKALADGILRDVIGGGAEAVEEQPQHATASTSATPTTAAAPSATVPAAPVPPVYLASPRDLSTTLSTLLPYFDGKETEHNWAKRESSIIKLRGILKFSPNHQLAEALAAETRHWAEPIMKAVASLRTTLAIHGIALVAEIATGLPYPTYSLPEAAIDVLLPGLLRMAGFTKRLVATSSQIAASSLLRNVAYRPKFMGWLWAGMADKTVSTRVAMVEHLHTLLTCVKPVGLLEQHDGVGIMCQFLSKGLADQNPEVRQKSREAFYVFRRTWSGQAEGVMEKLDPAIKKQVMNGLAAAEAAHAAAGPASAFASPRKAAATPSAATSKSAPSSMDSAPGSPAVPQPPPGKFVPSRRPGGATGGPGPSSAIVAAKRAAAAKMAEMRRQEAAAAAAAAAEAEAAQGQDDDEEQGEETIADARTHDEEEEQGDTSVGDSTRGGGSDEGDATPTKAPPSQPSSSTSRRDDDDDPPPSFNRASSGMAASRFLSRHALDDGEDEDDTVQLGGPSSVRRRAADEEEDDSVADFDASVTMDLMAAPVELPVRRSNGGSRAQPVAAAARGKESQDASSSSSRRASSEASAAAAAATPPHSSSRLPRPVSMMMGSPSPTAPRQQQPTNIVSSLQSQSQAQAASSAAPTTPTASAAAPTASGQGWFLNRAARLSLADDGSASSPLKSKPDSLAWVEEVRSRRADVSTFRQLAKLSGQFRVAGRGAVRQGGEDGIRLGARNDGGRAMGGKERLQDEVDDPSDTSDTDDDPTALSSTQRQQTEAWREGHLFELLFSALEAWFQPPTTPQPPPEASSNAAAQVLLHRLVENQFALFTALGLEGRLLRVALYGMGGEGGEAAAKAILTAWATRTVPAVGLAVLRAEGEKAFTTTSSSDTSEHGIARLLVLTCLAHLFSRLPRSVVFEDELPRVSAWVLGAINDSGSVKARQEGVKVLVAAVRGREGEEGTEGEEEEQDDVAVAESLQKALGEGLKREQVDLVLYYVAKGGGAA